MGKGDSLRRKSGSDGLERKLRKLAGAEEPALEPESFARCYQLEALEMAKKRNTIVFLDTGAGKTLIAVMLLRSYAYFIRKPSECIAVFLVPTVVLVQQVICHHLYPFLFCFFGVPFNTYLPVRFKSKQMC
ncbi:hypothetical protein KSP40_PGU011620 [Platanthera guangdongensis]|uniref:DEAD/DEAH-box helicase domain-containing protein n=1 Tax=Platanthera guangdongensis TaxID=2320717 RepID=A0ABR2N0X1_9ASPA